MTLTRPNNGQTIDATHIDQFYDLFAGGQMIDAVAMGVDNTGSLTTGSLQTQVTAAISSKVPLFLRPGTYLSAPINVTGDLDVIGCGWDTICRLANSSNGYFWNFQPPGGTTSIKVTFDDFAVDGNAANQTSGGCIWAAGSVQSHFNRLHLYNARDTALYLYQIGVGNFGHHNRVTGCLFDQMNTISGGSQRGIVCDSNDENFISHNDFENWGGLPSARGSEPHGIWDRCGLQLIFGNVFVGGPTGIKLNGTHSFAQGNCFDGCVDHNIRINGDKNFALGNWIFNLGANATANTVTGVFVDNVQECAVRDNFFLPFGGTTAKSAVDLSSGPATNCVVEDNTITTLGGGTWGTNPIILGTGTGHRIRGNKGWNPVGNLTAPAIAASTVAVTNNTGYDCQVYVNGGTVSAVAIGGVATGVATTGRDFRVPARQTITLTYSVAPTWTWFAD